MRYDIISDSVSVGTGCVALANIQEVLSVIVLIISIANILFNMAIRIFKHYKEKHLEKISEDLEQAKDDLNNLRR